ncbi:MAG: sigma-70 family RNA polymerase sigma factor [Planctomycetes bacterium]|nr:sigma-70 family RNA polymerase sigma factor [Planctomycetota bacterium]
MQSQLEQLAREHGGRLISVLTRIFGPHNLELAEDVVQESFVAALDTWTRDGVPEDPAAWLLAVARRRAIDSIRRERTRREFAADLATFLDSEFTLTTTVEQEFAEERVRDDELRMIFMCCHTSLGAEDSILLILKSLCGFSVQAVARALVLRPEAVRKRLTRTRERVRGLPFEFPRGDVLQAALATVRRVLYLLFNEGCHASGKERPIERELCFDAMRLTKLIVDEKGLADGPTIALLALMCFHAARLDARVDDDGNLVGLDAQDRSRWNQALIRRGLALLVRSRRTSHAAASRELFEAAIAARHCTARTFEQTDWASICNLYDRWIEHDDDVMARLNHAIAISYRDGPEAAIPLIEAMTDDARIASSAVLPASLALLYRRAGRERDAARLLDEARARATSVHELSLLEHQYARVL